MTLVDEPLIQLVAKVAHRRQADFLERVFGEERGESTQKDDDQHRHEEVTEPGLAIGFVPPTVKLLAYLIGVICDPTTLAHRLVPLEDGIDDTSLFPLLP